mgnify:CR=1 FL=1
MPLPLAAVVAAAVAGCLAVFDLANTFYIPRVASRKAAIYSWWWLFVAINALLAAFLYLAIDSLKGLQSWPVFLRALFIGLVYPVLVRSTLFTIRLQEKEAPFGLEHFYLEAKRYFYSRINILARQARYEEAVALVKNQSLTELAQEARGLIDADVMLTPDQKQGTKAWILETLRDKDADDFQKGIALALKILRPARD